MGDEVADPVAAVHEAAVRAVDEAELGLRGEDALEAGRVGPAVDGVRGERRCRRSAVGDGGFAGSSVIVACPRRQAGSVDRDGDRSGPRCASLPRPPAGADRDDAGDQSLRASPASRRARRGPRSRRRAARAAPAARARRGPGRGDAAPAARRRWRPCRPRTPRRRAPASRRARAGVRVTRSRCGSTCVGAGAHVVQPGASKAALPGKTERTCPSGPMPDEDRVEDRAPGRVGRQLRAQGLLEAGGARGRGSPRRRAPRRSATGGRARDRAARGRGRAAGRPAAGRGRSPRGCSRGRRAGRSGRRRPRGGARPRARATRSGSARRAR